jgi:hypothetical protein
VPHIPGASTSDPEDLTFVPDPREVVMLDATHAVLITAASAGELPSGGSYVIVGTYFFNKDGDAHWTLAKRIDVATWGIQNESWEVKTEKWPEHGVVLSLITEGGNQGAFTKDITMTLLTLGHADHLLHASLSQQDDGSGTELDSGENVSCHDLEMPSYKLPVGAKFKAETNCHAAEGAYRFDGDLIRFKYRMVSRTGDENKLLPLDISTSQAVYQFQAGSLKLIVGKDPELGY